MWWSVEAETTLVFSLLTGSRPHWTGLAGGACRLAAIDGPFMNPSNINLSISIIYQFHVSAHPFYKQPFSVYGALGIYYYSLFICCLVYLSILAIFLGLIFVLDHSRILTIR